MEFEPQAKHSEEIIFYDKLSNFDQQVTLKTCLVQGNQDYTLRLSQNEVNQNELALANSDFSIQLLDLNTSQLVPFQTSDFHKASINSIKFSNIHDNEQLQNVIFTASSDGVIKLWDRRNGQAVSELKHQGKPFYSVDCDKQIVCAGSKSEVLFWDLRKMKFMMNYRNAHNDDVTQVKYHPLNSNWLLTCSTDNLLCHFDFNSKPSLNEDDTMEGVYCSEQPLIDCGYISNELLWAQTSINTIEIITVENNDIYAKITKFPHQVDYVISCGEDKLTNKFVIYCGNNKGEVYIYDLIEKDKLNLVDIILTKQDTVIRNCVRVSNDHIALTTEKGDLQVFKYNPKEQLQQSLQKMELMEDINHEEDPEESNKTGKKKNNKNAFKPY